MNRPPTESKRIAAADLRAFGTACLRAAGMSATHAAQLADLLTNSDLRGVRSHGTRALYGYCCTLRDKKGQSQTQTFASCAKATPTSLSMAMAASGTRRPCWPPNAPSPRPRKRASPSVRPATLDTTARQGHYVRRAMAENCVGFSVQAAYPQYYPSNDGKRAAHYGNPPSVLWPARTRRTTCSTRRSHLYPRRLPTRRANRSH